MTTISRLCVYCGSAGAVDQRYRDAARELGECLADAGIELVFGGGRIGLMGIVADAVLAGGGRVTGVIPDETAEILTWRQLGLHDKPIFVVDVAGYWQPLRALLDHIVAQHFAAELVPRLLLVVPDVAALIGALGNAPIGGPTR